MGEGVTLWNCTEGCGGRVYSFIIPHIPPSCMEARLSRLCVANRRQAEAGRGLVPDKSVTTRTAAVAASTHLYKTVLSHRDIYIYKCTLSRALVWGIFKKKTLTYCKQVPPFLLLCLLSNAVFRLTVVSWRALRCAREIYLRYFSVYLMFNEVACWIHPPPPPQPISVRSMLTIN